MESSDLHIRRLRESLTMIDTLLQGGLNAWSPEFRTWKDRTTQSLKSLTGDDGDELKLFESFGFWNHRVSINVGSTWHAGDQARYEADLARSRTLLADFLEEHAATDGAGSIEVDEFWQLVHPDVALVARPRFESQFYADAVRLALIEVNNLVKARFTQAGKDELDGSKLMQAAFSLSNPVIRLDDLSTESGKNVQQGYMQIFAGAMTGIRNPKSHEHITIDRRRAIHLLFLASLLRGKLDDAK